MGYLSATTTFLYYLLYPTAILLGWILALLTTLAAPFLYLGHYVIYACWYPFHILAKFEVIFRARCLLASPTNCFVQTLYIYFGVATLVGILTGTSLYYISVFIRTLLNLDGHIEEPRGRTAAVYRAEKKEKQKLMTNAVFLPISRYTPQASLDVSPKEEYVDLLRPDRGRRKGSLIGTTILEEDDSSEEGF